MRYCTLPSAHVHFGPVIVHVFRDHLRDFYNLEGLWQDAPRIHVQEAEGAASTAYDPGYNSSGSMRF